MLTNNGIKVLKALLLGGSYIDVVDILGNPYTQYRNDISPFKYPTGNNNTDGGSCPNEDCCCICVGSGGEETTRSSYKLSEPIVGSITRKIGINNSDFNNDNMEDPFYYLINTFVNTSDASVTIREIGWFSHHTSYGSYMIDRKVLENPVVLGPGETITFTYTMNL